MSPPQLRGCGKHSGANHTALPRSEEEGPRHWSSVCRRWMHPGPPKPQAGRSTRRTQHIRGAGDGGGEEDSGEDDADGPSATWSRSKQAQLAAGWVPTKPTACTMGSLMVALGGSIIKTLISGHLIKPVLSLDQVSHPSLVHPWYFLSFTRVSLTPSANRNSHLIMLSIPCHVSSTGDPEPGPPPVVHCKTINVDPCAHS